MLNVIEIHRIKDFIKSKRLSKYEEIAVVKKKSTSFHCNFLDFHRSTCWQPGDRETPSYSVSEDCLYLNVFVPVTTVSRSRIFRS